MKRRTLSSVIGGIAALALIGIGVATMTPTTGTAPTPQATDLRGSPVAADTPLSAGQVKRMDVSDADGRFRVPAVGLDVALRTMNEVDGEVTPPGFTDAYIVRDLGVAEASASEGTMFVAMHSLRGGAVGPGNHLIDVADQKPRVHRGDVVEVSGHRYRIRSSSLVSKEDLPDDAVVWKDTPGRLVIITCMQRPEGGPSHDNMVTIAQLDE